MTKRKHIWIILALLFVLVLLAAPRIQRGYTALLLLTDLAGYEMPKWMDSRPRLIVQPLRFTRDKHHYEADLYRPATDSKSSLLLIHGAVTDGKDNPRLIQFAAALGRSGFRVLVPNIPSLKGLMLNPDTSREIAHSYHYLLTQSGQEPINRVGITAISVALGPALIAAQRPELADKVDFMLAIGGYHDLPRVLTYHTTGHYRDADGDRQRTPNEYAKWVFVLSHLDRLQNPSDRHLLHTLAYRRLKDPKATADDLLPRLGPEGRQVLTFIDNRDPANSRPLMSQLPPSIQSDIAALNLATRDLSGIRGNVILVHGLDDNVIPAAESQALYRALPVEQSQLFIIDGLHHVATDPSALDSWKLWRAIDALLTQRSL
jgi:esterase/lipase